ncbi:MAG: toxin [Deltaproteobacteria bacterium]|nr:toxin [Deltaproteobacteria bacterium]
MLFIEAPAFTRNLPSYLTDDEYRRLQAILMANPEAGVVMPQTGGFRKCRWPDPRRGKGTRGGLRIIYYWFPDDSQIWLMTIYGKNEIEDLTAAQKRALKIAIDTERRARAIRPRPMRRRMR